MIKFDYAGFRYSYCDEMIVVNAQKYTPKQAIEIFLQEYEYLFGLEFHEKFRTPLVSDVKCAYCAYRMGVSDDYPNGCYTLVNKDSRGAFPVHVIYFSDLIVR